jgi:hypothetical protein
MGAAMIPVDKVQIEGLRTNGIGLGKIIYTKKPRTSSLHSKTVRGQKAI